MACPYFHAVKARTQTDSSRSAMLPLGDAWDGVCHANADAPFEPDEAMLRSCCNMGYARGCCSRFPDGEGPDAVRFVIAADNADSLRVYYVLERDHHPFSHGPLEFSRAGDSVGEQAISESTLNLAHAYVSSYLRRISEASPR